MARNKPVMRGPSLRSMCRCSGGAAKPVIENVARNGSRIIMIDQSCHSENVPRSGMHDEQRGRAPPFAAARAMKIAPNVVLPSSFASRFHARAWYRVQRKAPPAIRSSSIINSSACSESPPSSKSSRPRRCLRAQDGSKTSLILNSVGSRGTQPSVQPRGTAVVASVGDRPCRREEAETRPARQRRTEPCNPAGV